MAGTVEGSKLAAKTIKELHGEDFYRRTGKLGGSAPHSKPRGFAFMKENGQTDKIRAAAARGGTRSRRKSRKEIA